MEESFPKETCGKLPSASIKIVEIDGYKCLDVSKLVRVNPKVGFYLAKIIAPDEKYKFQREFVRGFLRDSKGRNTPYVPVDRIEPGQIYEVKGGSWKNTYRKYFRVLGIFEKRIDVEVLKEGQVLWLLQESPEEDKIRLIEKHLEACLDLAGEGRTDVVLKKLVEVMGKERVREILADLLKDKKENEKASRRRKGLSL